MVVALVPPSMRVTAVPSVALATQTVLVRALTARAKGSIPTGTVAVVLSAPSITVTVLLRLLAT